MSGFNLQIGRLPRRLFNQLFLFFVSKVDLAWVIDSCQGIDQRMKGYDLRNKKGFLIIICLISVVIRPVRPFSGARFVKML